MYILISGMDARLFYLAELLKENHYQVQYVAGQEQDHLSELNDREDITSLIYIAGKIPEKKRAALTARGAAFFDIMLDPSMKEYNAIATAEGAISEAVMLSEWNLSDAETLVIGYGCCGKAIAERCRVWGANVTIAARREETRRLIHANGFQAIQMEEILSHIGSCLYIMNTVPALILDAPILGAVRKDSIILDIASAPGGVDYEVAKQLGVTAKLSLAIPGRIAPRSSARKLFELLEKRIKIESEKRSDSL